MLNVAAIRLSAKDDKLVWSWNKANGQVTTKEAYSAIVHSLSTCNIKWQNSKLWKWSLPLKVKCFFWLPMENKILIWKKLIKKEGGWAKDYVLCGKEGMSLFMICL